MNTWIYNTRITFFERAFVHLFSARPQTVHHQQRVFSITGINLSPSSSKRRVNPSVKIRRIRVNFREARETLNVAMAR